ncbi:MAG: dUTP diphosphatase [Parcubacteria group bacterium]|nr:dUTP diphosphatase [Parcubacteria group bacterium]
MDVIIKRCRENVQIPQYQTAGAVGFDFAAAEPMVCEPGKVTKIPTGIIMKIPEGYMLQITARSSTSIKRGLMMSNGVGTIDQDYCGPTDEIHLLVYNFTPEPVHISAGDRLANGIFIPVEIVQFKEVELMTATSRGGFGSTGI